MPNYNFCQQNLAISHPPKILFLDEYTSSIDPKASHEIMKKTAEIVDKHKTTAVMITHNLEDAVNYGTRLIVLDNGKVAQDYLKPPAFSMRELKKMLG